MAARSGRRTCRAIRVSADRGAPTGEDEADGGEPPGRKPGHPQERLAGQDLPDEHRPARALKDEPPVSR